jgi:hypothetical protein
MKKQLIITTCTFVLAIAWVLGTKANIRFGTDRYTNSLFPGSCLTNGTKPADCVLVSGTNLCTVVNGGTLTYYQSTSCVTAWYRL